MRDRMKEIFFPLFALFVVFCDELFLFFFIATGAELERGMRVREAIAVALVSYILLAIDFAKGRVTQRNFFQLGILFIIMLLYILTGLYYPNSFGQINHMTYLKVYGSLCIPAAYVGMRLARGGYELRVLRYLPYFLLLTVLSVGYITIFRAVEGGILGRVEGDVTNYQAASYTMSFSCTMCLFLLFLNEYRKNTLGKLMYCLIVIMALVSAIGCIVGGGRGAFLHLVSVTGYIIYRLLRQNKRDEIFGKYFLVVAGAVAMVYLSIRFNIFESAGAMRVAENLTTDSVREYTRNVAIDSFLKAPIVGHGIGSIWWEVGFYSHNMLLDFLVETGLIGSIIMIVTMCSMLRKLMRSSRFNSFDMFILLLFLYHIVGGTFSGYWLVSVRLFIVFGYVYGKNRALNYVYEPVDYGYRLNTPEGKR